MKRFFTIILLFSAYYCFGQNTFRTGTISSNYNQLTDLVQLADGSLVGLGYSEENSEEEEFIGYVYLVKINKEGKLVASYRLTSYAGNDIYADAYKLIKTNDGNLAFCGSIADEIALFKFDTNLNLLFRKQYKTSEESSYGLSLIQTQEGGYVLAGVHYKENTAQTNYNGAGILIKTNDTGKIVWSKQYADIPDADYGYTDLIDIALAKDGNYVIMAQAGASNRQEHDSTYLIKTDTSGKVLWSKYMTTKLGNQMPYSLLASSDGGFIIAGAVDTVYKTDELENQYRYNNAMIVKCDSSGKVTWSERGNNSVGKEVNIYRTLEDKDGGFIFSGVVDSTDGIFTDDYFTSNGYIFKTNKNGAPQWAKVFDNPDRNEDLYGLTRTNDGGYAVCGDLSSPYDSDSYYDSSLALVYKFDAGFSSCRNTNEYGTFQDLGAAFVTKEVPFHSIAALAFTDPIITSIDGQDTILCSHILPLQLLSFTATLQNKSVGIEWKTANEINTDHFTIERSSNGTLFTALQTVPAKGNGSTVQTYRTNDLQPLAGISYYRLKQVDKDGKTVNSNIVQVTVSANGTIVISPNPVRNDIHVLVQSASASKATFTVADITGKVLLTNTTTVGVGTNTIVIPAASLSKGLYVLKIKDGSAMQAIKFIKE